MINEFPVSEAIVVIRFTFAETWQSNWRQGCSDVDVPTGSLWCYYCEFIRTQVV